MVSGCFVDDIKSPRRTYSEFLEVAYDHAGPDAVDCGSGDISDINIVSCLQNAFDNGMPAVGVFWRALSGSTALAFKDTNEVTEYSHFASPPERGGDGRKAITQQFLCTDPSSNINAKSGYSAFHCDERILIE
jgi:hypothetical protein